MFFFYTNELNFSEEFMGGVELTKSLSMLLAIFVFNLLVKCPCVTSPDMLLRPTLLWGTILSAAASLLLGHRDEKEFWTGILMISISP